MICFFYKRGRSFFLYIHYLIKDVKILDRLEKHIRDSRLHNEIDLLLKQAKGRQMNISNTNEKDIQLIANRFANHLKTNSGSLVHLNQIISYMIAAKLVGDYKLFADLGAHTKHKLDPLLTKFDVVDNCYDEFDTAIERHLYRKHNELYTLLKHHNIRYLDVDLISQYYNETGSIYLPEYDEVIDLACNPIEHLNRILEKKPTKPKDVTGDKIYKIVKNFIIYKDRSFYLESDPTKKLNLNISMVEKCICTPDQQYVNPRIGAIDNPVNKFSCIQLSERVNLNDIPDNTRFILPSYVILYYNETKGEYYTICNENILYLGIPYPLDQYHLVYTYSYDNRHMIADIDLSTRTILNIPAKLWTGDFIEHNALYLCADYGMIVSKLTYVNPNTKFVLAKDIETLFKGLTI